MDSIGREHYAPSLVPVLLYLVSLSSHSLLPRCHPLQTYLRRMLEPVLLRLMTIHLPHQSAPFHLPHLHSYSSFVSWLVSFTNIRIRAVGEYSALTSTLTPLELSSSWSVMLISSVSQRYLVHTLA